MVQFLELQGCETKFSSTFQSKKFIEGIKSMKGNSEKYKDVKAFASSIIDDNFFILGKAPFINYWAQKEQEATRIKSRAAERSQALRQVDIYADTLAGLNESNSDDDSIYSLKESTSSSTSSVNEDEGELYQYLTHNGDSYSYELPIDGLRWVVSGCDVSQYFINYRNDIIKKAENLDTLNNHEQLTLDGIILIDNDFFNTDIVDYHVAVNVMKDIDEIEYCKPGEMADAHYNLVLKVAQDMAVRNINNAKIEGYIGKFKDEQKNQDANDLCDVLNNFLRTYSFDYSTSNVNEATLVRDTFDNIFKVNFPNTTLTKSVGADAMISDSTKLAPERMVADFSVTGYSSASVYRVSSELN
ncbi:hypothetical protein EDC94DRAFT_676222 [Helicostylum pulchrum]|nr:hypothetical protein EDC94DRAFT_676222 [Helicostylum pulchrum]